MNDDFHAKLIIGFADYIKTKRITKILSVTDGFVSTKISTASLKTKKLLYLHNPLTIMIHNSLWSLLNDAPRVNSEL